MSINESLLKLYSSYSENLFKEYTSIGNDSTKESKPTYPLMLKLNNEADYLSADIRVMFFGQETNGWYEDDDSIVNIQNAYNEFYNTGYCYKYGGHFWNGVNRLKKMLNMENKNMRIEYIWYNIIKIGKSEGKGAPPDYIYQIERKYFPVINEEIHI